MQPDENRSKEAKVHAQLHNMQYECNIQRVAIKDWCIECQMHCQKTRWVGPKGRNFLEAYWTIFCQQLGHVLMRILKSKNYERFALKFDGMKLMCFSVWILGFLRKDSGTCRRKCFALCQSHTHAFAFQTPFKVFFKEKKNFLKLWGQFLVANCCQSFVIQLF